MRGVDLSDPLADEAVTEIQRALLDHGVLVFRDQTIDEAAQVRFTSHFGRPVAHVREQPDRPVPEIFMISNVTENGEPIGALGNDELAFHSDLSYMPQPGTISVLYAIEVPETGGQTQWANCYAAYEALNPETQASLSELRAVHRHPIETQNPAEPADHPVVRTHSETGRRSLYVSPHLTRSIVGLSDEDSRDMLNELCDHLTQSQFVWTHDWAVGDLVMWDNRPTMHRRLAFPADQRRIMKRTQVFGDETPQP